MCVTMLAPVDAVRARTQPSTRPMTRSTTNRVGSKWNAAKSNDDHEDAADHGLAPLLLSPEEEPPKRDLLDDGSPEDGEEREDHDEARARPHQAVGELPDAGLERVAEDLLDADGDDPGEQQPDDARGRTEGQVAGRGAKSAGRARGRGP